MKNAPIQTANESALDKCNSTTIRHLEPCYPDPNTVHGQALGAFLRGDKLTTLEARPRLHTTTITQSVQKLRRAGWCVVTERITVPTADGDRQANIGRYSLPPEAIIESGDEGKSYAAECSRIKNERRAA